MKYLFWCALFFLSGTVFGKAIDYCKLSDQIVLTFSKQYQKEHGLSLIGAGGGFMDDIYLISLDFETSDELSLQEARGLYIEMAEDLLARYNANEQIRPYLHRFPFQPENIELSIHCSGEIVYITDIKGCIHYVTKDSAADKLITLHKEPYEEAVRIVRRGPSSPS